jgi:dienelactone hydrolase
MAMGETGTKTTPADAVAEPVRIPGVDGDLGGLLYRVRGVVRAPAVVVLPEVDGFSEGTSAAARQLCTMGYAALALDLYAPYGGAPVLRTAEDTAGWLARLHERRQLSDLALAVAWLRAQSTVDPDRLALVGFSIGGRYSLMLATEDHGVGAVAALYTRPWPGGPIAGVGLAPGEHVHHLRAPVCVVFGAQDEMIPSDMAARYSDLLQADTRFAHEVHVLEGRHYFANTVRLRRYLPASAATAWEIVGRFFDRHLGRSAR